MARTQVREAPRRAQRWARTSVLAGSLMAVVVLAGRASGGPPEPVPAPEPEVVVIRSGDTLWEIARSRVGPEGDPRPMVIALREANGLGTGPLMVGTRLVVPSAP